MRIGSMSVVSFPICSTSNCPTFVWLLNCRTKKCVHVIYPICPTTMMLNIPIWVSSDIPRVRHYTHSLGFQIFEHVSFYSDSLLVYKNEKLKRKLLLKVTKQPIPCKTYLRGNFQFLHYKYCNEHLTLALNVSLIKTFCKKVETDLMFLS